MSSVVRRSMLATLIGTLGVALAQPVPAQAQVYTYQGLADTRPASQFVNFGPPAINDAGDVAFAANLKSGGSGIYKWSAVTHTLVTIFEDPTNDWLTFLNPFAYPALTRTGEVIFQVGDRIMAGSGGSVRPIADSSYGVPLASLPGPFECQQPTLLSRTATDDGEVVVACLVSDGGTNHGQGVYLADGGALQRVCDFVSLSAISNIFPRCFQEGPLEVSPSGVLAGIGLDPTRMDPFGFPRQILVRGTTNLEVLLDPGVHTALAFPNRMSHLGINDAGTVAFDAYQDAPGGTGFAIFRIDTAGVPISVTDPRNFVYRDAHLPSINAVGEIPFLDGFRNGIFIGPDPVANKVVGRTDTIPGYAIPGVITSVTTVSLQHPSINRLGEVAFIAFLGDGTFVIARALPPTNHPPDVTIGDQSSPEGTPVQVHVTASDQDGDYPLQYSLSPSPLNPPPPGTIAALPSPSFAIDSNGDITGTPDPGTAGNRYAVRITVEDSRGKQTTVDIIWTITEVLPPPRVNLVASTNVAAEAIDLSWQNPTPDTAEEFWIGYSSTGSQGPFLQLGFGPLSTTSLGFTDPLGNGTVYCFTAKGVVTRNGNRVFSVDSNIACTNYPIFTISPPVIPGSQLPGVLSTPTTASFVVTTAMAADLTLDWPNGAPAGAQVSVTPDAANKVFTVLISNLPSAPTQTSYTVLLNARTRLVGLVASRSVSFVTTAASQPGPGPGRVSGQSAHQQGPIQLQLVGTATLEDNLETQFVFEITNRGPAALHNIRPVVRETYATSPCIALYESCSSATLQLQRPVSQFFDWFALESLAPGRSAQVTLRFPRAFASLSGYSGNPELHLVLRYDGAAADLPFILNAAPLPNVPTNLVVTVPRLEVSQGVARLALRIFNFGPAPSGDFTLAVSVTATRSASDPTPVSVAMQAFDYEVRTRTDVVVGSGRCMPSAPSFTCTLPSVEAPSLDPRLADRPVYIVGTTTFVAPSAGYVSVTATVRSRLADADDRDNTETVDTTLVPPPPTFDLAAGGFIGGEMIIQNAGPAAAFDVLVQVALPSNWRLSPASASSHCSGSRAWGATVMCQIPLVPVGGVGEPIDIEIAPGGGSQGQMWILQSSGGTDINHLNDTVVF